MTVAKPHGELETSLSEVALALFAPGTIDETLERIVSLAVAAVEGCDCAGILLVDDDRVVTRAYNDPVVVELDGMQVETGEGPCLNAVFEGGTIYGTWSMTHVGLASAPRPTPRASAACSPFDCPTGDRALSTFAPA